MIVENMFNKSINIVLTEDVFKVFKVSKSNKKIYILDRFNIYIDPDKNLVKDVSSIKDELESKNIKNIKVNLILGDNDVKSEIINIPRTSKFYQRKIIKNKYIEYEVDSYIQYIKLENRMNSTSLDRYLVYVMKKDRQIFYKKLINLLSLKEGRLSIMSSLINELIKNSESINGIYKLKEINFLYIDISNKYTTIYIFLKKSLSYLNTIKIGWEHVAGGKLNIKKLEELVNIIKVAIGDDIKNISLGTLGGNMSKFKEVKDVFENIFNLDFICIQEIDSIRID